MQKIKLQTTNEYKRIPYSPVGRAIFNWYYDTKDRYLIMEFEDHEDMMSAYNTAYGMSKRRHRLPIKRWQERNRLVVERLA